MSNDIQRHGELLLAAAQETKGVEVKHARHS
jgi:hypothetical protein